MTPTVDYVHTGQSESAWQTTQSRAPRLAADAAEAAQFRAYLAHPDVVAMRVERIRAQVDRLCWAGIVLGLAFTMSNVQHFAAAGSAAWSLPWLAAWLLDPTVSLVLLAILRAEQVTARYQVRTGPWVRRAKWFTLAATYVMNTWSSWAAGSAAGVVLHSVPPLVVFVAAEAVTDVRDKLTEAVQVAYIEAVNQADVHEPAQPRRERPSPRTSFADYLNQARQAWTPGTEVTPAWVRSVTNCSRGLSSRLAAALAADVAGGAREDS
ncbi:hypothetical protein NLX83_31935 [Allokutzneria sp. A3M-2-11 16]|uniref:hypothetical protein n=1 Tax=Allokutzneria sp. A3M-2-11 16 TaxID=2962043 RepID=UPI0020B8B323|nr:hypothetical protein [Allokutzneria sp. A3M-2-11 16]MCP3803889.1 hypothetical protein [Allokutzneria sp. A3M-2-11 16]